MQQDERNQGISSISLDEIHLSKRSFLRTALALLLVGAGSEGVRADGATSSVWTTFQTPEAFLAQAFGGSAPPAQLMDLDANKQGQLSAVFGKSYPQARLRYWKANGKSAWVLEDLGKPGYQLTTAGFVVKGGAIEMARVLIYRESRGEQVGEASFLKQFDGARLVGASLDRNIDNISGATLSVLMMQRMARAAIKLDSLTA
ncbi:MAG: FMN-binding protein [Nevskia sp.]|nr:FMN-binding protein [Nevskia sp.]